MKMLATLTLCLTLIVGAMAQSKPGPIRLKIRSADPWFVKAMLEGTAVDRPELSTIPGFGGLGNATGQAVRGLLSGGKLIVNPTDNSLWWYPD